MVTAEVPYRERARPKIRARLLAHGDPDVIAAGGYSRGFNRAMQQYIRALLRCKTEPELRALPLRELIQGPLNTGWITYFAPYEETHRDNLEKVSSGN